MVKSVTLNLNASYENVLKGAKGVGVLRARDDTANASGSIVLYERNWGEFFEELLIPGRAQAAREKAAAVLDEAFAKSGASAQLTNSLKKIIANKEEITGDMLVKELVPVAREQSDKIEFITAKAAKVKCQHAILRTSTAQTELGEKLKDGDELAYFENFSKPRENGVSRNFPSPSSAAENWICIADVSPPTTDGLGTSLSADILKQRLDSALQSKTGAVVVELIPDLCKSDGNIKTYGYSVDGMRAQLAAVSEAMLLNKELTVTFACDDPDVMRDLQRVHKMYQPGKTETTSGLTQSHFSKQAPATPGLHFLGHEPLDLYAERLIMPTSELDKTRLKAITGSEIKEKKEGAFEGIRGVQLIELAMPTLETSLSEQFTGALLGAENRVVIYPGKRSVNDYREMLQELNKAIEENPGLSISIVQPEAEQQMLIATALDSNSNLDQAPELDWKTIQAA